MYYSGLFWLQVTETQMIVKQKVKRGRGKETQRERDVSLLRQLEELLWQMTKLKAMLQEPGLRDETQKSQSPGFPLSIHSQVLYSWSFFPSYWSLCGRKPVPWQAQFSNPARKKNFFSCFYFSTPGKDDDLHGHRLIP